MTPHDTIIVSLPYPVKFLTLKRKIGFTFTNLYKYLMWVGNDKKPMSELRKEKSEQSLFNECLYWAAVAYCQTNKKAENFTKDKLIKAVVLSNQATQESIIKVWNASETFGATIKESKKKVNQIQK